ncbi:hypothetical protein QBC41DRAFT_344027 [Cercophora samala]|uniref:Uncharacterized protein n=1 Tax=Cercophora samala TaxID=330535 RepID=A0AA40DCX8_9PEZI|nr:hypothetical protein QBC41DRAFT_344027 [Cercophora samala]
MHWTISTRTKDAEGSDSSGGTLSLRQRELPLEHDLECESVLEEQLSTSTGPVFVVSREYDKDYFHQCRSQLKWEAESLSKRFPTVDMIFLGQFYRNTGFMVPTFDPTKGYHGIMHHIRFFAPDNDPGHFIRDDRRLAELFESKTASSLGLQIKALHKLASQALDLRQSVRLQLKCLNHAEAILPRSENAQNLAPLFQWFSAYQVVLKTAEEKINTQLEQLRNLLSLRFNLETMEQTQTVARLTVLAFLFLPLSFVATIFGMTTLETSVVWYPAAAFPLLVFTIVVVYVTDRLIKSREAKEQMKHRDGFWRTMADEYAGATQIRMCALR